MVVPKGWRSVNGEQFSRLPDFSYFADVPSHSCLENRVAEGTGSYQIIHQYLQEHPQAHEKLPRFFLILIVVTLFRKLKIQSLLLLGVTIRYVQ